MNDHTYTETPLDAYWQFRQAGTDTWMPAQVPGTVHGDLLALGKIPDPFYRTNEDSVQWIEREDWEYQTTFRLPKALQGRQHIALCFEGLDTYADVYLNDSLLLRSDNMYCTWELPVEGLLRTGDNDLRVVFRSPVGVGMEKLRATPYMIPATNEMAPFGERTSVFSRKAPYHYGWDWGLRLTTSGIWRPVVLRAWDEARLLDWYFRPQEVSERLARYRVEAEVQGRPGDELVLRCYFGAERQRVAEHGFVLQAEIDTVHLDFEVQNPRLWWPNGLGEPHRYPVSFEVWRGGTLLDRRDTRLGIRTVALVQRPDSVGTSFHFEVNGVPVFMKGANYIPPDILLPRITTETYARVVQDAVDANMNMLRVWGGAVYEDDRLYELCDEKGLLVWQDFMFACAMYPATEDFMLSVKREAEQNVRRLRNYACMALWCGNNENLIAWHRWGWQQSHRLDAAAQAELWGAYERIFYDILPAAVRTQDPDRGYWPSSPSSSFRELPNPTAGDDHDWRVWFSRADFHVYGDNTARFVSEYGLQAFPEWRTIEAFTQPEDRELHTPVMVHRQRSMMPWISPTFTGNDMMQEYVLKYFRAPTDFRTLTYVSQLMQAEALKTGIEVHRRRMPYTMGSLYWQIDDCWPTQSWATVDYYGRWKAGHYAVRQAFGEVLVSPAIEGEDFAVYVVSDRLAGFDARLELRLLGFDGTLHRRDTLDFAMPANTSRRVFQHGASGYLGAADPARTVLALSVWAGDSLLADNLLFFLRPRALDLPQPHLQTQVQPDSLRGGYRVTVYSDVFAKGVYLRATEGDGFFSDNYFDLLPGGQREVHFAPRFEGLPTLEVRSLYDTYAPGPPAPLQPEDKPWSRAL
ncbi:MAG: glycoside hydrolase family 2 TIM barrel-domain containing protein [Bacteroidia bacterium]